MLREVLAEFCLFILQAIAIIPMIWLHWRSFKDPINARVNSMRITGENTLKAYKNAIGTEVDPYDEGTLLED